MLSPLRRLLPLLCSMLLLAGCASPPERIESRETPEASERPAWMPPPMTSLPYGSRVGIMNALANEIAHVNAGTAGVGNFRKTYPATFDYPGYVTESLRRAVLRHTPYQPLIVRPSARLLRDAATWQDSWNPRTERFAEPWQQELDAVIRQNQLRLLIVISAPELDDAIPGTAQTLLGSGLYTRKFLGRREAAVFSTIRFHRIAGQPGKLLMPVTAPSERTYADIANFPVPEVLDQLSPATLAPVQDAVKALADQKVGAFVSLMK